MIQREAICECYLICEMLWYVIPVKPYRYAVCYLAWYMMEGRLRWNVILGGDSF